MHLFFSVFDAKIAYASLDSFISKVDTVIINPLINFLFALAVLYFLYGALEFLLNQDNEEKKTSGKSHMLWGVVGLVIMVGVFAILNVILSTLGISKSDINPETGQVNLPPYNPSYPPKNN